MTKKNEKRLCWNCDGGVSLHLTQCPYCGVDLSRPQKQNTDNPSFKGFASPFQTTASQEEIPKSPYANLFNQDFSVTEEDWKTALGEEKESVVEEEDVATTSRREVVALLLLLPGVVFFLFGLILWLFSTDGVLTLEWSQNFAYLYFLGAIPLLYLGWRALR